MIDEKQLESDIYRLKDQTSLKKLFVDLNYDNADEPTDRENWNTEQLDKIEESRIISKLGDFRIFHIINSEGSDKNLKDVATKIISRYDGRGLICSQKQRNQNTWMFSALSKDFSKNFKEVRHFHIEIKSNEGVPKSVVDFFKNIQVEKENSIQILKKISDAFDNFALELHDELTVNVYEALKVLSEGIIGESTNKLKLNNETLNEIREPIFILLYRIIFVLYVEDRSIFPIEDPIYFSKFSLKKIKTEWLLNSENAKKLKKFEVQEYLKNLFFLIANGSEALQIDSNKFFMRAYYGRLFDRVIHSKLENWKISNEYLLKAISFLAQTKDKNNNVFFLDYSVLEIRHLGSIYEHLLEFHLEEKNGKIKDLPNPKDRKTSGSYYTPKYVVDYIVENTLEPLIVEIIHNNQDKFKQIEKILELKVIDPAMGSGHFLVGAVEYLAKRLCEIEHDGNITESDFSDRKRDVVRKCIYGVDYNELAVDLAKLSLWLETISKDKPLTFLMARLKHGNSIIGENLDNVFDPQEGIEDTGMAKRKLQKTVQSFLSFEDWEDDSSNTVKAKGEKYDSMVKRGTGYFEIQGLLNHKIAEGFGLRKLEAWRDVRQKIGMGSMDYYLSESGQTVDALNKKYHFFHWELEFPEIFYDINAKKKKNPGFDAVIGNPPYVKEMENKEVFEAIKKSPYKKYHQGKMDYWHFFVQRAIDILKTNGRMGYITNSYWIKSAGSSKLVQRIKENLILTKCIDFDGIKVFKGVNDKHMIHLYQKATYTKTDKTTYVLLDKDGFNENITEENQIIKLFQDVIGDDNNLDFSEDVGIIFRNCDDLTTFYDVAQGVVEAPDKISKKALEKNSIQGIEKGDGVFVLSKMELESLRLNSEEMKIIKKYLNPEDIGRYFINFNEQYLIYSDKFAKTKISTGKFPNLKKHLDKFKKFITSSNGPYGIHRFREQRLFERPKLLCKSMFNTPEFCYDEDKYYVGFSFSSIIAKNPNYALKYLLGLLNSSLGNYWFHKKGKRRGGGLDILVSTYRKFPVYKASPEQQKKIINMVNKLLELNKNLQISDNEVIKSEIIEINNKLDDFIFEMYALKPEHISYIKENFKL